MVISKHMKQEKPIDITSIPRREPVVTRERIEEINLEKTRRQWKVVTEKLKRAIQADSEEVVKTLLKAVEVPLSEELPYQFLSSIGERDNEFADLLKKYKKNLGAYLEIPSVPDDQLVPDTMHADYLPDPERKIHSMREWAPADEHEERIQNYIDSNLFMSGVSFTEKLLVLERYKMARDIKLLGLAADLQQSGVTGEIARDEFKTEQGVQIKFVTRDKQIRQDFLNPSAWQRRAVIKDRVFLIQVGDKEYVLKEKKTTRHKDTPTNGTISKFSSFEELGLAKDLSAVAQEVSDEISVAWEQGLAAAEFPDGYQFVLFEKIDAVFGLEPGMNELASGIFNHREWYEEEYQKMLLKAAEIIQDPERFGVSFYEDRSLVQRLKDSIFQKGEVDISYETFSYVKAGAMIRKSRSLSSKVLIEHDLSSDDADFAYKVIANNEKKKIHLEAIEYDLEYFSRMSPDSREDRREAYKQFERELKESYNRAGKSNMDSIASLAMKFLEE